MSDATLTFVRAWPCEAVCEAPGCTETVDYVLKFDGSVPPGLEKLYLCSKHAVETEERYA